MTALAGVWDPLPEGDLRPADGLPPDAPGGAFLSHGSHLVSNGRDDHAAAPPATDGLGEDITPERLQEMLEELAREYSLPDFQDFLREEHRRTQLYDEDWEKELPRLTWPIQERILPKYGFEATPRGVVLFDAISRKYRSHRDAHYDIARTADFIDALVSPWVMDQFGPELNAKEAFKLIDALIAAFSAPEFQVKLHKAFREAGMLKQTDAAKAKWEQVRAGVCSPISKAIIPEYGFEASEKGVFQMVTRMREYSNRPDCYPEFHARERRLEAVTNPHLQSEPVSGAALDRSFFESVLEQLGKDKMIMHAATEGDGRMLELLDAESPELRAYLRKFVHAATGRTAAHMAAEGGHSETIKLLKRLRVPLDILDRDGRTAAHYAAQGGHVEAMETLRSLGLRFDTQDMHGAVPAHYAAKKGHMDVLRFLEDAQVPVNVRDRMGKTLVHYAIEAGLAEEALVGLMELRTPVSLDAADKSGRTPAHYAAAKASLPQLIALHNLGANLRLKDEFGRSPEKIAVATRAPWMEAGIKDLLSTERRDLRLRP